LAWQCSFPGFIGYNGRQLEETMSFAWPGARSLASRAQSPDGAGSYVSLENQPFAEHFPVIRTRDRVQTLTVSRPVRQSGRWNPVSKLEVSVWWLSHSRQPGMGLCLMILSIQSCALR
jgi:hypothetical protein